MPIEAPDRHDVDHHRWQRWACTTIGTQGGGEDRYRVRIGDAEYRLFWADTHCHSSFSADVEGEVDELIHFGRDQAGLDAMAVIDNDYYPHKALTEPEWRIHQAFSAHFTRPGQFVLFPGYEFTFHSRGLKPDFNHRCVIYPRPGGRLLRRIDPETLDDESLFRALAGSPAMTYPHHCSYRIVDARFDWNVEVCSSWRICLEETDFTIGQLREGHRFGFVGSSDTHRAVPGLGGALTGLYATALTPEALFDAYRSRRCIATQGSHVHIDFRVAGFFIGSSGAADPEPDIQASVEAPERIEALEVVRDGEVIRQEQPRERQARMSFRDVSAEPGAHFYFLRARLAGDPSLNFEGTSSRGSLDPFTLKSRFPHNLSRAKGVFAWTSPVWVTIAG